MQGPVGTHHSKILPTLPHASARSRPTTAPDASPSCARPSPAPPRRSRPGSMPLVSITKLSTPGNRGSRRRELLHTFRYPMPAADPRTGRGEGAHQRRQTVGFAALPHDIAADPRLSPTDLRVLAALLYYARQDPSCYPSDASIAARVHRHPGTVRRCLKRLEDLGYIRREFVQATPANPTGRLIHLTCNEPDWPRPASGSAPSAASIHPSAGAPPPERGARSRAPMHTHAARRRTPKKTSS